MTSTVSIAGLDKADILRVLFNHAKPVGRGYLHCQDQDMTKEKAAELVEAFRYFDYVEGRPLKIDLRADELRVDLYDRNQGGAGTAERLIDGLRQTDRGQA